jgi:electron transfer flavoprotein alpha subunit
MTNKIWIYIDHFKGAALLTSWEAFTPACQLAANLGGGVTAVVIGQGVNALAQEAIHYGADEVLVADDPSLADYRAEAYVPILAKAAAEAKPEVFFFPTTTRGRELAAMAAIDLNTGIMPDVIALDTQGADILATRPVYAGKVLSQVKCAARPQILTLRVRAFAKPQPDAARTGTVTALSPVLDESQVQVKVLEYATTAGGVSLTDAGVIVSGGRGVSNNPALPPPAGLSEAEQEIWRAQQGFKLVGALAEVMGGAMGASRAAVDAHYVPYENQVGQTGKVVSPDLYIACGISGAIQHLAGMRTSKLIVAINKDPEAPIFKLARYGVVGNLFAILPPLTDAMKQRLGK